MYTKLPNVQKPCSKSKDGTRFDVTNVDLELKKPGSTETFINVVIKQEQNNNIQIKIK